MKTLKNTDEGTMKREPRILIACEFSGVVREAFAAEGCEAWSCDLLPTEMPLTEHSFHHQGDVRELITIGLGVGQHPYWDLMIAHPPCTRLCNSGVSWLHRRNLWDEMRLAALFFKTLLDADVPRICVENPVMHRYAYEIIGKDYVQAIQPWQYGEDASKKTCLWLKNLPRLEPTKVIRKLRYANQTKSGQNNLGPSPDRAKERSKTYPGIARAMARQWIAIVKKDLE